MTGILGDRVNAAIIVVIVVLSATLDFVQTMRSQNAAEKSIFPMRAARVLILYNQPVLSSNHPNAESEHEVLYTVEAVSEALARHEYLADEGLATAIFLSLRLGRPLLLEGEAGVGKTEVAKVLSRWTGGELLRLQCYEGIDAAQAVYEWDYSRQLLHLRAVEASHAEVHEDDRAVRALRHTCLTRV